MLSLDLSSATDNPLKELSRFRMISSKETSG